MKGIIVERAVPSNVLDVYALFKESVKEGSWGHQTPRSPELTKEYYFQLLERLKNAREIIYVARKGRHYCGYVHGTLVLHPFNKTHVVFLNMLFVQAKRRKLGIGKQLTDRIKADCLKMGVTQFELMCNDQNIGYWAKRHGAKKAMNLMSFETRGEL